MKKDQLTGTVIPRFLYDTPTAPGCDFYALCAGDGPLVMVFLPNFGHPISREYLKRYLAGLDELRSGRLACVVRSAPQRIAQALNGAEFPFALICDAEGVLYDHFGVRTTRSLLDWTPEARRIFRAAKADGYRPEKGEAQLLPLTLVVDVGGEILYAHHGQSLTDLPEDCAALERVCAHLLAELDGPAPQQEPQPQPAAEPDGETDTELSPAEELAAVLTAKQAGEAVEQAGEAAEPVEPNARPEVIVAPADEPESAPDAVAEPPAEADAPAAQPALEDTAAASPAEETGDIPEEPAAAPEKASAPSDPAAATQAAAGAEAPAAEDAAACAQVQPV